MKDYFIKYLVADVNSVEEFIEKYYKKERIGCHLKDFPDYKEGLVKSYSDHLNEAGITWISKFDSVTGNVVSFKGGYGIFIG